MGAISIAVQSKTLVNDIDYALAHNKADHKKVVINLPQTSWQKFVYADDISLTTPAWDLPIIEEILTQNFKTKEAYFLY